MISDFHRSIAQSFRGGKTIYFQDDQPWTDGIRKNVSICALAPEFRAIAWQLKTGKKPTPLKVVPIRWKVKAIAGLLIRSGGYTDIKTMYTQSGLSSTDIRPVLDYMQEQGLIEIDGGMGREIIRLTQEVA